MDLERFYQLLSRKMAGQATESELQELFALTEESEALRSLYRMHTDSWLSDRNEIEEEVETSFAVHTVKLQMLQAVQEETEETSRGKLVPLFNRFKTILGVAAAVGLLWFGINYFLSGEPKGKPASMAPNEVVTKKGSRSTILLPDGTSVSLNADSKLSYNEGFGTSAREVTLSGEAFFDVKKDSTKPFIIHTEKMNIKVLGTSFNVKNYPEDELIETALIHGKIEVNFSERPAEKIFLKPGEKLLLRKSQKTDFPNSSTADVPKVQLTNISPLEDSTVLETAWINNKVAFNNATLKEIANQLERQFDVEIAFADAKLMDYSYTGIFEKENPERILHLLSLSHKFNFITKNNKIVIMR